MHERFFRQLLNQHSDDGSPGGGAPPASAPPPQAQGAGGGEGGSNDSGFDRQAFAEDIAKATRDSIFAELRRSGVFDNKGKQEPKPPSNGSQPAAPAQAVDVHSVIRREQEISEAIGDHPHLSKDQRRALRQLLDAEQPEDIAGYIAAKAKLFGAAQGNPSNPPPAAPSGRPVSDAGAPAPAPTFTEDTPLWQLDSQSRQRLVEQKGMAWYRSTLRKQAKGHRVRLRSG